MRTSEAYSWSRFQHCEDDDDDGTRRRIFKDDDTVRTARGFARLCGFVDRLWWSLSLVPTFQNSRRTICGYIVEPSFGHRVLCQIRTEIEPPCTLSRDLRIQFRPMMPPSSIEQAGQEIVAFWPQWKKWLYANRQYGEMMSLMQRHRPLPRYRNIGSKRTSSLNTPGWNRS